MDRYAPRSFLELLGDEEMNREVVRWLKTWDRCVFGEDRHKPGRKAPAATRGATKQGADLRPPEKILLICGAPGGHAPHLSEKPTSARLSCCNTSTSLHTCHSQSHLKNHCVCRNYGTMVVRMAFMSSCLRLSSAKLMRAVEVNGSPFTNTICATAFWAQSCSQQPSTLDI